MLKFSLQNCESMMYFHGLENCNLVLWYKKSQPSKYCLAKDISKPLGICIITQSKCD